MNFAILGDRGGLIPFAEFQEHAFCNQSDNPEDVDKRPGSEMK